METIVWCLIAGTLNVTVERYLLMKKTFIRGNESSYYHEIIRDDSYQKKAKKHFLKKFNQRK